MPEILHETASPPPSVAPGDEILIGQRAFTTAQTLFAGSPVAPSQQLTVGWYDTSVQPLRGSFAVVPLDAGFDDLIAKVLSVSWHSREVFAYVVQAAELPDGVQLGLARRAFLAIERLSLETIAADVVVIG